jgi:FMN phosphatase YigB (HAD superfamily)
MRATLGHGELVALIDFGNTLADETFLWRDSDAFPDWTRHWSDVMTALGPSWDKGLVGTDRVLAEMAARLPSSVQEIESNFDALCQDIHLYPQINAALSARRARGGRQAVVTVNPDCFGRMAEVCDLPSVFELIVTSSDIGSDDKVLICSAACQRLGIRAGQSILIDNIAINVERWKEVGGQGYLFTSDEQFAHDVQRGRIPGFDPL